ncbi:uncharacterized protein LOC123294521 [Chrysoperla carnea]|uniref:uncharacterized protein LOC123294521 n=1 Tax=Chrysoperla carnea TaxID=189513 RepID=UPI001D0851BD|nr:uncharacterized protein LOC123294521 [Chrysoperla carnea]
MNKYPILSEFEVKFPIPSESEKKVRIKGPHKKPQIKGPPGKGENMNEVTINLPSLVDLALGHPEVGAVNFNIMQCIMHAMLKETGLQNTELEFHGEDATRIKLLEKIHPVQSQYILSDYEISEKEKNDQPKKRKISVQPVQKLDDLEDKVNKINDTLYQLLKMPTDETVINAVQSMGTGGTGVTGSESERTSRIANESGILPTPTNLWHLLTVEKRVEAAEEGIDKLTSLIETLVTQNSCGRSAILNEKEMDQYKEKISKATLKDIQTTCQLDNHDQMFNNIAEHLNALTERIMHLETRYVEVVGYDPSNAASGASGSVSTDALDTHSSAATKSQDTNKYLNLDDDSDQMEEMVERELLPIDTKSGGTEKKGTNKRSLTEITLEELLGRKGSLINALTEIDYLKNEFNKIKSQMSEVIVQVGEKQEKVDTQDALESICKKIEPCLEKVREQITQLDSMFHNQVDEIQHQIANIELELGVILEKVNSVGGSGGEPGDAGGFTDVYNKLARIQNELAQITSLTSNLQEDKDEKEAKIEALMESIDFLKSIKADKEEIEDALANKADQQHVNRKVSHDQFDAACDDLSRNLEDALLKLTQQEEFWNETLEAIQNEIENKLDRTDIQPLHDFVTEYPVLKSFIAGSFSGTFSTILFQPLDLVKTRLQNPVANSIGRPGNAGMVTIFAHILQREHLWGLWRGMTPSITRCVPGVGLYFSSLDWLKTNFTNGNPNALESVALGMVARSMSGVILIPITVIKTRYESGIYQYTSMGDALRNIYRTEGIRGLTSGLGPTLLRDAPFSGLYLMFYNKNKKMVPQEWLNTPYAAPIHFSCGVSAGIWASFVTQPFDVIKTKMQLYPHKYTNVLSTVVQIHSKYGVQGYFKGIVPRMLRRTLMAALAWTLYEQLSRTIGLK